MQFVAGVHELVDAVELNAPFLQFFGFHFALHCTVRNRLITARVIHT